MSPKGDNWEGAVRRNALAQDLEDQQDAFSQKTVVPLPTPTPGQRLQQDLQHLKTKTEKHLAPPSTSGMRTMSKFKLFLLFLLFLLAGFFFFVGGFLTCYTTFPPRPVALSGLQEGGLYGQIPPGLGVAPATATGNNQTSYAQRQSLLRGTNSTDLLAQAENRTRYTASVQTRSALERVLSKMSQGLRTTLGPYLGASLEPLTTGLARSAVAQTLPLNQARSQQSPLKGSPTGTQKNDPLAAPPSADLAKTPINSAGYTILVQECASDEESQALTGMLRAQGFGAYVVKEQTAKGRVEFVVKAGQFTTYAQARDAAALLGRQFQRPVRVALLRPAL